MKKERYDNTELEIIRFTHQDVVTTSGNSTVETSKSNDLPFVPV